MIYMSSCTQNNFFQFFFFLPFIFLKNSERYAKNIIINEIIITKDILHVLKKIILIIVEKIVDNKRELADIYKSFFDKKGINFMTEPKNSYSNYWLNTIILENFLFQYYFQELLYLTSN